MKFVLVHGVAHGAWCWEYVQRDLEAQGHEVIAVDLPLTSLADDAAHVREVLEQGDEKAVLVGHSYGGMVISEAADADTVERMVFVAALMVERDADAAALFADDPSGVTERMVNDGGTFTIAFDDAIEVFYATCPEDDAKRAAERLRPTALACIAAAPGREPWRELPSTYVLCEQDAAIPPSVQRKLARNAGRVVTFDCDHSPFYSMREALVEELVRA